MNNNISGMKGWADDLRSELNDFVLSEHKGVHKQVIRDVIANTPVVTGQLKGAWLSGVGGPNRFAPGRPTTPEDPATTSLVLSGMQPGDSTWINNNERYANKIESGDGNRPGRLMAAIAVSRVGGGQLGSDLGGE